MVAHHGFDLVPAGQPRLGEQPLLGRERERHRGQREEEPPQPQRGNADDDRDRDRGQTREWDDDRERPVRDAGQQGRRPRTDAGEREDGQIDLAGPADQHDERQADECVEDSVAEDARPVGHREDRDGEQRAERERCEDPATDRPVGEGEVEGASGHVLELEPGARAPDADAGVLVDPHSLEDELRPRHQHEDHDHERHERRRASRAEEVGQGALRPVEAREQVLHDAECQTTEERPDETGEPTEHRRGEARQDQGEQRDERELARRPRHDEDASHAGDHRADRPCEARHRCGGDPEQTRGLTGVGGRADRDAEVGDAEEDRGRDRDADCDQRDDDVVVGEADAAGVVEPLRDHTGNRLLELVEDVDAQVGDEDQQRGSRHDEADRGRADEEPHEQAVDQDAEDGGDREGQEQRADQG